MGATSANNAEFQNAGKPVAQPAYIVDTNGIPKHNGATPTFIAAGTATNTTVKTSAGVVYGMLITTSAAGTPTVYDDASTNSGNIVSIAPATTVGFTATPAIGGNCLLGITVAGSASNPGIIIYWS